MYHGYPLIEADAILPATAATNTGQQLFPTASLLLLGAD